VAAAWTIAKTMLPSAPADVQKSVAANLLSNPTKVLNAMLRQTAKNAHYSKAAESFARVHDIDLAEFAKKAEAVHKTELNDLLEPSSVLSSEQKNAAESKTADDRKDAGPQTETYNDGRGCGGGKHTEPKEMDAGSSTSQTEAANRPENTINKSEGDKKASAKQADFGDKKAPPFGKKDEDKVEDKKEAAESCAECKKLGKTCESCSKSASAAKKADDTPPMDAPAPDAGGPPVEAPMDAPPEEAPMDELPPVEEAPVAEGEDNPAEVLSDEKKMVVEEKIEEAQEAIKALEQEILQEGEEELDLSQVFSEDGTATEEMEEKVSALANESDEHTAGNGEEYFKPSAAENMEAGLDEPQMASMEDFFSLRGSDSDPLAHLIAGEIKTAEQVAGHEVIPSFTGELANKMESNTADTDNRDNESDHDGDLFAEAIEDQKPEDGGFKRVKQDETNEMEAPKSASKAKATVIKKLKPVTASEQKPVDIASALFGNDEF